MFFETQMGRLCCINRYTTENENVELKNTGTRTMKTPKQKTPTDFPKKSNCHGDVI